MECEDCDHETMAPEGTPDAGMMAGFVEGLEGEHGADFKLDEGEMAGVVGWMQKEWKTLKTIAEAGEDLSLGQCMFLHKEMRAAAEFAMDEESAGIFTQGAEDHFAPTCGPLIEEHTARMVEQLQTIEFTSEEQSQSVVDFYENHKYQFAKIDEDINRGDHAASKDSCDVLHLSKCQAHSEMTATGAADLYGDWVDTIQEAKC